MARTKIQVSVPSRGTGKINHFSIDASLIAVFQRFRPLSGNRENQLEVKPKEVVVYLASFRPLSGNRENQPVKRSEHPTCVSTVSFRPLSGNRENQPSLESMGRTRHR